MKTLSWVPLIVLLQAGCMTLPLDRGAASTSSMPIAAERSAAQASVRKVRADNGVGGEIRGVPSPDSRFARLRIGMPDRQVQDLIGMPDDSNTYMTGKLFIPFYYGKDSYRIETFYKGEGQLTFSGGGPTGYSGRLIRIIVDPGEDGYR